MRFLFFIVCLQFSFTAMAQSKAGLSKELVNNIEQRIANEVNPSIAIGIIDENGTRYYSFGTKTLGGEAVDEHTIYEIGSISKTFTAILLANMAEQGTLKVDDPAQKHLPTKAKMPTRGEAVITLGHLSDHTSALPRMPDNFTPSNQANPYADYTFDQLYAFISSHELRRDIGSEYEYSNLAQGLLGQILAIKADTDYEALMIDVIAKPLKMKETKIVFDERMKKNLAVGHADGMEVENWDIPTLAGAGAIRSSTHDLLKYLAANMGLQKSKLYPAMKATHQVRHDKAGNNRVGLGWHIMSSKNGDIIWHNGGTGGYRAFAGFIKETKTGVVVFTNATESVDDIGIHLLDPSFELRTVKKSITSILRKAIKNEGIDAAIQQFNEIKKNEKEEYDFGEVPINALGYTYMNTNLKAALAIFKLNVEMYPEAFNVYDSYGEALMKDGQKELAIENYKKSIELNPGNTNGIEMLAKMGVEMEVKELKIQEDLLETYVGTYELAPQFNIVITRKGEQLFGQATGQPQFELFAKSETEFYLKVVDARVVFTTNDAGMVESLTLFQGGQEILGKKTK